MAKRRRNKHKNKPQTSSQATTQQQGVAAPQPTNTGAQNQIKKLGVSLQTIEQERAKHALAAVLKWIDDKKDQKELRTYVVGMPAMILMSGFGQTCAFYKSKGDNHALVLDVLEDWLKKGDLMGLITQSSAQDYQLVQAESLAYLNWLKKFAKAYLKDDTKEVGDVATS